MDDFTRARQSNIGRLGILGGSFDPVHYGHLLLAEFCREACRLDQLWFMPAVVAPHKQHGPVTSASDRIEMLRLAIGGHPNFQVSTREIERGGISYTVDTLEAIHAEYPSAELYFLMGADSLEEFSTWRSPARILELAIPVCVRRHGAAEPSLDALRPWTSPERLEMIRRFQVDMPRVELSSTEIRRRIAAGLSIRYQTPRAVEEYIATHGLYR